MGEKEQLCVIMRFLLYFFVNWRLSFYPKENYSWVFMVFSLLIGIGRDHPILTYLYISSSIMYFQYIGWIYGLLFWYIFLGFVFVYLHPVGEEGSMITLLWSPWWHYSIHGSGKGIWGVKCYLIMICRQPLCLVGRKLMIPYLHIRSGQYMCCVWLWWDYFKI